MEYIKVKIKELTSGAKEGPSGTIKQKVRWSTANSAEFWGGSFGTIEISYGELVELFGNPKSLGKKEKTRVAWIIKAHNGLPMEIYDRKHYTPEGKRQPIKDVTNWYVGGSPNFVEAMCKQVIKVKIKE